MGPKRLFLLFFAVASFEPLLSTNNVIQQRKPVERQENACSTNRMEVYARGATLAGVTAMLFGLVYLLAAKSKEVAFERARKLSENSWDSVRRLESASLGRFRSDVMGVVDIGGYYPFVLKDKYMSLITDCNALSKEFSQAKNILTDENAGWFSLLKLKIGILRLKHCDNKLRKKLYKLFEMPFYQSTVLMNSIEVFKDGIDKSLSNLSYRLSSLSYRLSSLSYRLSHVEISLNKVVSDLSS